MNEPQPQPSPVARWTGQRLLCRLGDAHLLGVAVFLLCLLAIGLRLWKIGAENLWGDEWFSRWRAYAPLLDSLRGEGLKTTPPLYYMLLKPWVLLFGDSEPALRIPSALAGALAIPLVARIGTRLFDRATGAAVALFLAVSAYHVSYSQEARMYSLVVVLGLLSTDFYLACGDRATGWNRAGYIVSSTAILYTHYFGGFVLVAHGATAAFAAVRDRGKRQALVRWVQDTAVVLLVFAPWYLVFLRQIPDAGGSLAWIQMPASAGVLEVLRVFAGSELLLAVFVVLFLLGILFGRSQGAASPRQPATWVLLSAWFVLPHLGLVLLSHAAFPLYVGRYAIVALPALFLGAAAGTSVVRPPTLRVVLVLALAACSLVPVLEGYSRIDRPQWREAVAWVADSATPDDLVLISPYGSRYYAEIHPTLRSAALLHQTPDDRDCRRNWVRGHRRVWYLQEAGWNVPEPLVREYVERERKEFWRMSVVLFERAAPPVMIEGGP